MEMILTSDECRAVQTTITLLQLVIDDDCHDAYAAEPPSAEQLQHMRQTHPLQETIEILNSLL